MIVLGIDPGFARVGYGVIKKERGKVSVIDFGCIITTQENSLADRLVLISQDVKKLLQKHRPHQCALEKLFFFKNAKTALGVAEARGALILSIREQQVPLFEYTPLQVKQALTGYGKADKNQIKFMVKRILQIRNNFPLDDTSDALAIAICHAHSACAQIASQPLH